MGTGECGSGTLRRKGDDGVYDLVIVGGGVWGTAAALSAVELGLPSVLLVEKNAYVAGESSAKAGGIVSAFVSEPDDFAWVARSRELFRQAQRASGDPSMIRESGMVTLAAKEHVSLLDGPVHTLKARGIPVESWDRGELRAHYPALDRVGDDVAALWTPEDWSVNPTAYATATLALAQARGLQVRLGWRVEAIRVEEARVRLEGPDGPVEAARVLIAAGTWTRKLVQTAGLDLPLLPYRTQLASLEFPAPLDLPIVRILENDMYFVPDGPQNLLAGDGTRLWEHDPDDYRTVGDADFEQDVARGLLDLTSRAEQAALRRSWAGLCGGTPDRRPLLGPVADRLVVACGDNGFGIKRGPAIGELAAKVALGVEAVPHLSPSRHPAVPFTIRPGRGGTT